MPRFPPVVSVKRPASSITEMSLYADAIERPVIDLTVVASTIGILYNEFKTLIAFAQSLGTGHLIGKISNDLSPMIHSTALWFIAIELC